MTSPQPIHGVSLTHLTQCAHYASPLDIIAIKMKCCNAFYACISCHTELAGHAVVVWGREERGEEAVYCGGCRSVLSIEEYMEGEEDAGGSGCGRCGARWNPGCKSHWGCYFEV
jgi:uncharacterized CHY-type Zn-finger protein